MSSFQKSSTKTRLFAIKMTVSTKPPSDSKFIIPIVDIRPYLLSPTSTEALKVVDQVRTACLTTGFFQLIGHGIPRSVQDDVFKGAEAFFSLPFEEKKKLDKSESVGASNRGYELIGNQGLQEGTLPDLKEVYHPPHPENYLTHTRDSTSDKKFQPRTPGS
jgi:isopenicillin N synthase-like dioxygenase